MCPNDIDVIVYFKHVCVCGWIMDRKCDKKNKKRGLINSNKT